MPDVDDVDIDRHDQATPANWGDAFASLPQETASANSWQRLQAQLPPTRQRRRWPLWLASAASLALVIAIPLRMQSTDTTTTPATNAERSATMPSTDPVTTQPLLGAGAEVASVTIMPALIDGTSTTATASLRMPANIARVRKPRRDRYVDPSQRPIRTVAETADTTRIASADKSDAPEPYISLEPLYAQSAQLESLLVLARDERVSNGAAAALIDTLSRQVADIDAALAQPDASPQERNDLWRTRVDTLRQLVGIETTQRLYAARGQQYEAALVSID